MPYYRRLRTPGGTFFFTLVTENRAPLFADANARRLLHQAFRECLLRRPFELVAIVLLLDHLHAIWTLPEGDDDYSTRWAAIKAGFTHAWLAAGGAEQPRSASRLLHRRRGVWQRKFWEHRIRDDEDFGRHLHYSHYNPVKHGLVACPHQWPHSTFERGVGRAVYEADWLCCCNGRVVEPPSFDGLPESEMELE